MAKIKIIDDDVEIAGNLAASLKGKGHVVSTLDRVEKAVELLLGDKPDLVILDVMFPGNPSGGFALARAIRETPALKNLPIILLTNVNQEFPLGFSGDDIDPTWMPVQDFLEKPVKLPALLAKIDKLLAP